jgi:hypothetical protein
MTIQVQEWLFDGCISCRFGFVDDFSVFDRVFGINAPIFSTRMGFIAADIASKGANVNPLLRAN